MAYIGQAPANKPLGASDITDGIITDAKIVGMSSSKLSGSLPAISGASLTGIDAGGLKQTVFTEITTEFESSSDSYVATPITASITPTSSSSKILIQCRITMSSGDDSYPRYKWHRAISGGSSGFINTEPTNNNGGSSLGTYLSHRGAVGSNEGKFQLYAVSDTFRDSPNTTSAITYTLYGVRENGGDFQINTSQHNEDGNSNDYNQSGQSNILLAEISV